MRRRLFEAWIEDQQDECYTSSIVVAQLAFWVRTKQRKPRRSAMRGRVLGFDLSVAHVWAEQQHLLNHAGQRMPVEDSYIAAIARRHNLVIATGNDKDYRRPGLRVFNPFKELP